MKILKASAGSGKTYQLSHSYIARLLESQDSNAYRHILAVTFTNKATAEMKSRILRDLAEEAESNPKARMALRELLHDYGAFSVCTIDRFFQLALKSFSREIGQFADYQVELDKKSLVEESMDRILDSLTEENRTLLDWIRAGLLDSLEQGERFSIDSGLTEIGQQIMSDEFRELSERMGASAETLFSSSRLQELRRNCRSIIRDFTDRAKALGLPVRSGQMIVRTGNFRLIRDNPALQDLFDLGHKRYCTAYKIDKLIYQLGIAGELDRVFKDLVKEKNVLCLDESNTILRDIIGGSDAPFVYEKLGVRYDHFLLDEFQDTSRIQWENFRPLLEDSEGKGGKSLIVGDVKQSIYRFRDSDWNLLGSEVAAAFPRAEVESKRENWRSARAVVDFNSAFFSYAAKQLGLSDIYADVEQIRKSGEPQAGEVRVSFTDNGQDVPDAVLLSVRDALSAGARMGDIAVIVRKNATGARIARHLTDNDIRVISDDSLAVKSSPVVRRLVSLLNCYENPEDQIGRFLADEMDIRFPEAYHSLVDFCEELLRKIESWDPSSFDGQILFIQAFMDELQAWVQVNGNNLRYFLKYWADAKSYIRSPESADAVRIITIHKSKGLEFPYVIFPYAEQVQLHPHENPNTHWCALEADGLSGVYPVDLRKAAGKTLFADALETERGKELVDNLNLFYVALTRAKKCLHIIAGKPSGSKMDKLARGKEEYSYMTELLYQFVNRQDEYRTGQPYDFLRMERDAASKESGFPGAYPSIALGGRLAPSQDAHDFFGEEGKTGAGASLRLRGIVLHDILSKVRTPDELDKAVDAAVRDGKLDIEGGEMARKLLREGIAAHPDWFPAQTEGQALVFNERPLYDRSGKEYRPDRVVVRGREVTVIDFKFGAPEEGYLRQVSRYATLWHELGYEVKGAYLWYVMDNKTVEVK